MVEEGGNRIAVRMPGFAPAAVVPAARTQATVIEMTLAADTESRIQND